MSGKKVAVFGIYSTRAAVENAADSLVKAGFPASDISVLLPESLGGLREMGTEKATKAPEGAAGGAATGRGLGGQARVLGRHPAGSSAARSVCWQGLDCWRFLVSALSSLPVRSWPASRGWASAGQ